MTSDGVAILYPQESGGGGGSSPVSGGDVATGALVANVEKSVSHGFGISELQLQVKDANNNADVATLKPDPADPTNKVIIKVGVNLPAGLTISVLGI